MRAVSAFLALSALFSPMSLAQSSSASSSSSDNATTGVNPEVAFLQTLQAAQISSMSCLITLVNMTHNPIGQCLDLPTVSELVVRPPDIGSFATQLDGYLTGVCAEQCTDQDIGEAKGQLKDTCETSAGSDLIRVLNAVLDGYTNSYRTLACSVFFNGTTAACLPSTLNTSESADNQHFFNSLITGTNLDQYIDSVFTSAKCSGCMYQLYKAAVYMIPSIRGNGITTRFGTHLQNDCGDEDGVMWSNVQDQQIPDALQVQQSTGKPTGAAVRRYSPRFASLLFVGLAAIVALQMVQSREEALRPYTDWNADLDDVPPFVSGL